LPGQGVHQECAKPPESAEEVELAVAVALPLVLPKVFPEVALCVVIDVGATTVLVEAEPMVTMKADPPKPLLAVAVDCDDAPP
jgi:hypothetical protein